ncbi:MAG: [protein-PII] uridylyltransferase [Gammaproteobacteria bacterium]|nr:[protein-PII] uridylyltransferase [Gammaproteobacteria bacterium]
MRRKRSIDTSLASLTELRDRIQVVENALAERFWQGGDVDALVRERAQFIDGFLCELWQSWFAQTDDIALFAVGGYGRGELHPKSDIDLLILIKPRLRQNQDIATFVRVLWDLKLEIGHSVRTVSECKTEAATDLSVMTTLLERRLLVGSPRLAQRLDRVLASRSLWPSKKFFNAKLAEQTNRHENFSDIEYGLEPNLKSSPGGLRDIQTISWITQKHCGTNNLAELTERGFLTEKECQTLLAGRQFLWRVRFALHLITPRRSDQLFFDHQREIAIRLGYEDSEGLLAVEAFMRDYYRRVLELREVNDILVQHFTEAILAPKRKAKVEHIDANFQIRNDYIETASDDVFRNNPTALLEIFVVMANRTDIRGVRANTIRQIRRHLHLIDEAFRHNKTVNELFITLLKSPYTVVSQLTRMRRYGILGAYIPEFGRIIGQMQHDLFHIYTVDAHTMALLRNLRRMFLPDYENEFPCLRHVVDKIPRVELLFIAGLFHDLGKGRGGNHSELSAADAGRFCERVGLVDEDSDLVIWLVQRHLLMSKTSQREDLSDPASIRKFASVVQSPRRLAYLMALTVADIHATNPREWNAWREALLVQLYNATTAMLERGSYDTDTGMHEIENRQQETAIALEKQGIRDVNLELLWDDVTPGFVLAHEPSKLAAIAVAAQTGREQKTDIVEFLETNSADLFEVFIYTKDRPHLFADCVAALDSQRLSIMNASIVTGATGFCYDTFMVMDEKTTGENSDRRQRIQTSLLNVMNGASKPKRFAGRRISRQLKQFNVAARVKLETPDENGLCRLELVTADRPGLMALISTLFVEFGIELHQARIATLGERAEDIFLVSGVNGGTLTDLYNVDELATQLADRINAEMSQLAA